MQNYVALLLVTYKPKVKPQLTITGQQSAVKLQLITKWLTNPTRYCLMILID